MNDNPYILNDNDLSIVKYLIDNSTLENLVGIREMHQKSIDNLSQELEELHRLTNAKYRVIAMRERVLLELNERFPPD